MKNILAILLLALSVTALRAQGGNSLFRTDETFFRTPEASRVGSQLLLWQRDTGGWPKNVDMSVPLTDGDKARLLEDKSLRDDSTIDNRATTSQLCYLARLYSATGEKAWRDSFRKGLEFLLDGQYECGGWPQFWPEHRAKYAGHVTFNDGAMGNVMEVLRGVYRREAPFNSRGLVSGSLRRRARKAFEKGVECILDCQIVVDGKPTVWCQQHDENTLEPAPARSFEPAAFCSAESAQLVEILMSVEKPSQRVKDAVNGAMAWFDANKIIGYEYVREKGDTFLRPHPDTKPLWARFYDFEECRPFVCGRDGVIRRSLSEIEPERRNGYGWYNNDCGRLYPEYLAWCLRNDPEGRRGLHGGRTAIHLIGDSTMAPKDTLKGNPERGWGMFFGEYFDSAIVVYNYAKNGRSTRSFITDGRWENVKTCIVPGDWVFIQFGHNDQKEDDPVRYADPWGAYRENLRTYIRETRELGGTPVLLTPVARRKFTGGVFDDKAHGDYPAAMKSVAEEMGVTLLDITSATNDWIRAAGDKASIPYFMWVEPGECEALPAGKRDNTHSRENGARRNCTIVCDSIRVRIPALAGHLK